MRTIKHSSAFKRDYKRIKATPRYRQQLKTLMADILALLVVDHVLPSYYRDHKLSGDWVNYRECHLKPDLLLIYKRVGQDRLELARLGSHSELFD